MARAPFYYGTTKKIIVAFATIFDEISIIDDFEREIRVPLHFSQKEKFMDSMVGKADYDMDDLGYDITFPRLGFELTGLNFAPERHLNPMNRIEDVTEEGDEVMMYNRIPYDLTFDLFIGARKLEDSLKVMEQIVPYFSPELNLTIVDKEDFTLTNNVPVILNSVAVNIDYAGSLDTKRTILWTLNFTVKAYYYPDVRNSRRIKQTVLDFRETDYDRIFERMTSTVTPIDANPTDPHTIVDTKELLQDE